MAGRECVKLGQQVLAVSKSTAASVHAITSDQRHATSMQVAQEKSERQGLGVSKEGQQIFDCFYKTMPCKWQGKTILVMGEVCPHSAPCVSWRLY